MSSAQRKLFRNEVNLIQALHALIFPVSQKRFIIVRENNSIHQLVFLKGYNLPTVITNEIRFAFKLC
jgi:hypothetical protein